MLPSNAVRRHLADQGFKKVTGCATAKPVMHYRLTNSDVGLTFRTDRAPMLFALCWGLDIVEVNASTLTETEALAMFKVWEQVEEAKIHTWCESLGDPPATPQLQRLR